MKPTYQTDRVTLYHGDCLEALENIPRKSVGLLATDPPYGIKHQSRNPAFDAMCGDDGTSNIPEILGQYSNRVLMTNRHVYVFGYTPDELKVPMRLGGTSELIWDKGKGYGSTSPECPWCRTHEIITFGVYEPSAANRAKGIGNLSARLRRGSVLQVNRKYSAAVNRHPTEKPVELMRRLVESSSAIGDTVLDPFAGSGSTLVAAVISGRKAVGVEIDDRYVSVAVERLKEAERVADLMERL